MRGVFKVFPFLKPICDRNTPCRAFIPICFPSPSLVVGILILEYLLARFLIVHLWCRLIRFRTVSFPSFRVHSLPLLLQSPPGDNDPPSLPARVSDVVLGAITPFLSGVISFPTLTSPPRCRPLFLYPLRRALFGCVAEDDLDFFQWTCQTFHALRPPPRPRKSRVSNKSDSAGCEGVRTFLQYPRFFFRSPSSPPNRCRCRRTPTPPPDTNLW